ncbi:MAG: cobyrinate a,c-diamide synthase [Gammaproteobacteria bacterium]|nr:cobyrinate a,c-diamide synthase [Gammaproteobacteria bacterium]MCB1924635.1 cobyrinate a,c-diamide synthase [Gammaproteobacteria bacterium]
MSAAHLYISAAHKSSGKTTLSIALCAALRADGDVVQPFKKGPDYIDPLWLGQAAGRPCHNLDFNTMQRNEIEELFAAKMQGADIGLIEGNKGLYDGLALDGSNSNAALAAQLGSAIVLVLDSQGMTRGVAPLILGYQAFDPAIRIVGVILNKVGGSRHEAKLRSVIEHYTDVRVIGSVHKNEELVISERHLGLVPSNELGGSQAHIRRMAELVRDQVDLAALREMAATSRPPRVFERAPATAVATQRVRLAYASDAAFGFYYAGDLEALRVAGAELIPFSPLHDSGLPACDGVFLGGGFPETHMQALEENAAMRQAMAAYIEADGPVYAECGGLMYLCDRLTWDGNTRKMAGVIPAEVVMHRKPQGRGYVRLRETGVHPWPLSTDGTEPIPAHEFHYSALTALPQGFEYAYQVERGYGLDGEHDGLRYRNLLASYAHLRDTRSHPWAARFVQFVRKVATERAEVPGTAGPNERK